MDAMRGVEGDVISRDVCHSESYPSMDQRLDAGETKVDPYIFPCENQEFVDWVCR